MQTVTLTGTHRLPDGTPHTGTIEIIPVTGESRPIRQIVDADGNVVLSGRVKLRLDETGSYSVDLPATDDLSLNPTGFGYIVSAKLHLEHLPAVAFPLPAALVTVDIADLTNVDPSTFNPQPNYSAYIVALEAGFVGTQDEWLATLVGPQGKPGDPGTPGLPGLPGPPGTTSWAGITDKPGTFPPAAHGHGTSEIAGLNATLAGKAALSHQHTASDVNGLAPVATAGTYDSLTGKPTTFKPDVTDPDLSATYATPYDSRVKPDRTLPAFPVATNAWAQGSSYGTTVTSGTGKTVHVAAVDCSDLRVVYGNANSPGGDAGGASTITVRAALEVNGVLYRVLFNGQVEATVAPGAILTSDPVTIDIPKGTTFAVRTYRSSTTVPNATTASYHNALSGGFVATADLTDPDSAAAVPSGGAYIWGPRAILGTPADRTSPAVLIVGDSIAAGYMDGPGSSGDLSAVNNLGTIGGGYVVRGLNNSVGWINVAQSGEAASEFAVTSRSIRRMAYANGCTHAIVEYGRNDLDRGSSLATIQANLLSIWNRLAARGLRVHQTTVTPKTTSTDTWATTGNQTVVSSESIRVALNDWIRTVPAPLAGYFDAADASETSRNSGIWKAGYTGDGIHPNPTGAAGIAPAVIPASLNFSDPLKPPTAGPGAPATSTIYASDGFDRANGAIGTTPVGAKAWTALTGKGTLSDWTVNGGKARFTSTGAGESVVTVDTNKDGRIIATLASAPTGAADLGIVFRCTDANNLWLVWTQGGGVYKLMKLVAAAYATVITSTVTATVGDKIRIDLAGGDVRVFVNGTQIAYTSDGFNMNATKHGLRVTASGVGNVGEFDNFQHASIPA